LSVAARLRRLVAGSAVALAAGACTRRVVRDTAPVVETDTVGTPAGWPVGSLELLAGRDSVGNPDRPVYDADSVSARRLWQLAGDGWSDPVALAVSPQRVFVLDRGAPAVRSVWRTGTPGPRLDDSASLARPTSIAYSQGIIAVGDSVHGVLMMDASGMPAGRLPSRQGPTVVTAGRGFAVNGGGNLWTLGGGDGYGDDITLPLPPADPAGMGCGRVSGGPWLVQSSCYLPSFRVLDTHGRVVRRVAIDREPRDGDARLAAGLRARLNSYLAAGEKPPRGLQDSLEALAGAGEPVRGVRLDPFTRRFALWSVPAKGGGTVVELFSGEGVYLARVRFRARWRDFAFDRGTLFALETPSAEGPVRLAAYALRVPGDAPLPAQQPPPPGAAR
jgi:hypothetical protein